MSSRDWEIFGREICRNVQEAIDSRDFSRLSQTINDTVYGAADEISRNVKKAVNSQQRQTQGRYHYQQSRDAGYERGPQSAYQSYKRNTQQNTIQRTQQYNGGTGYNVQLYSSGAMSIVNGIVLTVIGGGLGIGSCAMLLMGMIMVLTDPAVWMLDPMLASVTSIDQIGITIIGIFGVLLAVAAALLVSGIKKIGKARRFRTYVKKLGYKEYGNIKELAEQIRKPVKYVIKDVEAMIKKGWFKQGHLDTQKTCLITSHEAYQQYTELEEQRKNQIEQDKRAAYEAEQKKKAAAEQEAKLSPEVREVIRAGEEYVRKIRACNDAIPGEEISDKIYKIERVVDSIFDRVEKNPEAVSDLHRMMEYYLPTTVKLLEAYESLDAEPVQGENILNSKREIEKTLDTLNVAFEKLLNSLFEDTAWDLSSDISVLHTMLAQEGLTEDQLKK